MDSAGATHKLIDWCRDGQIRFSVGYDLTQPVRAGIANVPENAWIPALDQDGTQRPNGQVAELTGLVDLSRWPQGTRLICRRERAHPGAQLSFTDLDGYRFQTFLTANPGNRPLTFSVRPWTGCSACIWSIRERSEATRCRRCR